MNKIILLNLFKLFDRNLRTGLFKITRNQFSTKTKLKTNEYKSVIGLEIHAQILSETKLFSGARNAFASEINSCVSLLDAGIPGCLPVLNKRCVEAGVKTALALNCEIKEVSMFDRKHYFYSDLPVGYQITQQRAPLAGKGYLTFPVLTPVNNSKPYYKTVRIHQIQLEQDSGKSLHDDELKISLIDLNRAGIPLMELVFEPDLEDGEEAAALVKELILIFNSIDTCSCKMDEGALRVDANVSIHKEGEPLGIRTEIKNIGSVRGVAQAIAYEIERQKIVKNDDGIIINETRQWDAISKTTIPMRDKEVVQDYRYMPEPNLLPLHLNMNSNESVELVNVQSILKTIPVLPQGLRDELINKYKLSETTAIIIVNDQILHKYFQDIINSNKSRSPKLITNILINELLTTCNKNKSDLEKCPISAQQLGELIDMLESQELSLNLARLVLHEMFHSQKSPQDIATENDWKQISDDEEIRKICREFLKSETGQKMEQQYRAGKNKILLAIAGEIKTKTGNKINMAKVMNMLKQLLK